MYSPRWYQFLLFVFLITTICIFGKIAKAKKENVIKSKSMSDEAKTSLNYDLLPPLEEVLKEIGFSNRLKDFVRQGVSETRILVLLKKMDFQMMVLN